MLPTLLCCLGFVGIISASISGHIASGTCVCLTTSGVNARSGAGLSNSILATLNSGECYKFNGGIRTHDGYHWYELQDVHGHHRVWIAGNYLRTSSSSHCSGTSTETSTRSSLATGDVSAKCLSCICQVESGCRAIRCAWDVNSNSCGYFQLKDVYWQDCGMPGGSLEVCAADLHCSSGCVQRYMSRYIGGSGCAPNCESYARIHNGGPTGCRQGYTLNYWTRVQNAGCSASS
ncbi:lysozyme-like [Pecten maximus]|uniref:lysozyme-like n=1 Tax=Pecten maximus TaxID=6579 RepID=UPI001458863A|nr:lysozyme-like [Pecten maximus]